MTMHLHVRPRARRAALTLGASLLLPTFFAPTTAGAAGVCSSLERMVWTGETGPSTERQVVVGVPGTTATTIISAGLSTANSDPVVSPDHRRIAWTGQPISTPGGPHEVFVADGDGSNARRLAPGATVESTNATKNRVHVSWAPFGERLAWADAALTSVHLADLQGGPVATITSPLGARAPQWAPNGLRLAWYIDAAQDQVVIAAATNGAPIEATANALGFDKQARDFPQNNFGWSPDNRRVAVYASTGTVTYPTYTLPTSGPTVLNLFGGITTYGPGTEYIDGFIEPQPLRPQWAPDGTGLAWSNTISAGGPSIENWGDTTLVNAGVVRQFRTASLSFSPDGSKTVSSNWSNYSAMYGSGSSGKIMVRDRNGNDLVNLSTWTPSAFYSRTDVEPAWSPAGDRVAWSAQKWTPSPFAPIEGYWQYHSNRIAMRAADGSGPTVLLGPGGEPAWSPSAHFIGASVQSGTEEGVRVYDSYTTAATTFTGPVMNASPIQWTSTAQTNLTVRSTTSGPNVAAGATFGLDIDLENWGPCGAGAVTVADLVPHGLTIVSATPSTGTTAGSVWSLDRVRLGATPHLHLELRAPASPGVLQERPVVISDTTDTYRPDNTAPWSITVT